VRRAISSWGRSTLGTAQHVLSVRVCTYALLRFNPSIVNLPPLYDDHAIVSESGSICGNRSAVRLLYR
jgi:hypothetical protein